MYNMWNSLKLSSRSVWPSHRNWANSNPCISVSFVNTPPLCACCVLVKHTLTAHPRRCDCHILLRRFAPVFVASRQIRNISVGCMFYLRTTDRSFNSLWVFVLAQFDNVWVEFALQTCSSWVRPEWHSQSDPDVFESILDLATNPLTSCTSVRKH